MARNIELEECLIDKTANSFQSCPEFAEVVVLVNKFAESIALTPFTFSDLELAFQQEIQGDQDRSQLLENFIAEVLHFFSFKFDDSNINKMLLRLVKRLNRWSFPPFDTFLFFPQQSSAGKFDKIVMPRRMDKSTLRGGLELEEEDNDNGEGEGREEEEKETGRAGSRGADENSWEGSTADSQSQASRISSALGQRNENVGLLEPDYLQMSAEDKLRLLCFLLDAQLACLHDAQQLDVKFPDHQLRISPLAVDTGGRKFWYFESDTWLLMEEGKTFEAEEEEQRARKRMEKLEEKEAQMAKKKKAKTKTKGKNKKKETEATKADKRMPEITQKELDEANANLFSGKRLRVVCKCEEHWTALIDAYKGQRNAKQNEEIIGRLEECLPRVRELEKERLDNLARKLEAAESAVLSPLRHSSRIARLSEHRKQEKEEKRTRHDALLAERRRIEEEQAQLLQEHRRLTDSDLRVDTMTREERLKHRQQRIQEQLDRELLVEAGLLPATPTSSSATPSTGGEEEEETDDEEEDFEPNRSTRKSGGQRNKSGKRGGRSAKVKVLKHYLPVDDEDGRNAAGKKVPRMPALDWWKSTSPTFQLKSLFGGPGDSNNSNRPRLSNWTPLGLSSVMEKRLRKSPSPQRKMSLIAANPPKWARTMPILQNSTSSSSVTVRPSPTNLHLPKSIPKFPLLVRPIDQSDFVLPNSFTDDPMDDVEEKLKSTSAQIRCPTSPQKLHHWRMETATPKPNLPVGQNGPQKGIVVNRYMGGLGLDQIRHALQLPSSAAQQQKGLWWNTNNNTSSDEMKY